MVGDGLPVRNVWVNLPAQLKMTAPRYQTLLKTDIPTLEVQDGKGVLQLAPQVRAAEQAFLQNRSSNQRCHHHQCALQQVHAAGQTG